MLLTDRGSEFEHVRDITKKAKMRGDIGFGSNITLSTMYTWWSLPNLLIQEEEKAAITFLESLEHQK